MTTQDENPPAVKGKYSTIVRHVGRAYAATGKGEQHPATRVSCNGCTACCRELNPIAVLPAELQNPRLRHDGKHLLHQSDGSCTHLINGQCEVYDVRPFACRMYDCRADALIGMCTTDIPETAHAAHARITPPRDSEDLMFYFGIRELMEQYKKKLLLTTDRPYKETVAAVFAIMTPADEVQALGRRALAQTFERAAAYGLDAATVVRVTCEYLEQNVFAPLREGNSETLEKLMRESDSEGLEKALQYHGDGQ